jgi:hypothetical protein
MIIPQDLYPLSDSKKKAKRISTLLAFIRIILFFLVIVITIIGISDYPNLLFALIPLFIVFIFLIQKFNYFKDLEAFINELILMEKEEQKRKARELVDFDSGSEFLDKKHAFCNDLDLFGPHSLFQLLNHTVSKGGKLKLATLMKSQINVDEAKISLAAIDELRSNPDFLKYFEAIGRTFLKDEKDKGPFYHWLEMSEKWPSLYWIFTFFGPFGGLAILTSTILGWIASGWLGLWLLVGVGVLSLVFKNLQIATKIWPNQEDIKTARIWAELLEKETFQHNRLKVLNLHFEGGHFSKALKSLEQISFMVQNRMNLVYVILNLFFWLDFYLLFQLKEWKKRFGSKLAQSENIFEEWEVLVSLSSMSNALDLNGEIIWSHEHILNCTHIKHPLLKFSKAIGNDFEIGADLKTILLTGANMSGKTTFMRTLGINLVMINLGLRPLAEKIETGSFQLFTSMRNTDSLGESVSSFYAELFRIRQIIEAAESGEPVFYLMDEILKGTNTEDRIQGSEALIKQLSKTHSKGIISTHDIELSELENQLSYLSNYSFHSELKDNEILFDYLIKKGPCPNFNAHKLMELMGVKFS